MNAADVEAARAAAIVLGLGGDDWPHFLEDVADLGLDAASARWAPVG